MAAAVRDEVGDGADLQAMRGAEQLQVGQPRHGAIVLHDFANDSGGHQAGHAGQVAAGLGMAGTHQHATVGGLQRKNVTGLHQVVGSCRPSNGGLHCPRTVRRRDAGGDSLGCLDRHRERRRMFGAVAHGHRLQAQQFAALARQRQADQAAAEAGHEIDGLRRDMLGRKDQIALVLPIFFVHQDHHAAGSHLGHDVFDGGDGDRLQCRRRHDKQRRRRGRCHSHLLAFGCCESPASIRST